MFTPFEFHKCVCVYFNINFMCLLIFLNIFNYITEYVSLKRSLSPLSHTFSLSHTLSKTLRCLVVAGYFSFIISKYMLHVHIYTRFEIVKFAMRPGSFESWCLNMFIKNCLYSCFLFILINLLYIFFLL